MDAGRSNSREPAWLDAGFKVPLQMGLVDPVKGGATIVCPLSPRLPGRIPLGLIWVFDSRGPGQFCEPRGLAPEPGIGGLFRPVEVDWEPVEADVGKEPSVTTIVVNGQPLMMVSAAAATSRTLPSMAAFKIWWKANGIDEDLLASSGGAPESATEPRSLVYASGDGTSFLVYLWNLPREHPKAGPKDCRAIFLHGPEAVGVARGDRQTAYFTTRYGDRVSVVDSLALAGEGSGKLVITNERHPAHVITAILTATGRESCPPVDAGLEPSLGYLARLEVSNTMGLPSVDMQGRFRSGTGFLPDAVTAKGEGGSQTLSFTWLKSVGGVPLGRLERLGHPNGLTETFSYSSLREGGPETPVDWPAIDSISTTDASGAGNSFRIIRDYGRISYGQADNGPHTTRVLQFAGPTLDQGARREIRLTHLSKAEALSGGDALRRFLFRTHAVIRQDYFASGGATRMRGSMARSPSVV